MNTAALAEPLPRTAVRIDAGRWAGRFAVYFTLILFALFFLIPVLMMITTSLKTMEEIRLISPVGLPRNPTIQPWIDAWSKACVGVNCTGLSPFYVNTFYVATLATIATAAIGAVNGFALTQVKFRGQSLVYALILFGCFTPYQATLTPLARTLGVLGLAGSRNGLVLAHVIYGIPFTTMFYRNFFITIPNELTRAAKIDGAGFLQTFLHVMLPMSLPITMVVIIFQFTGVWNDFLFGVAFASGGNVLIMVALNNIVNSSTGERPFNVDMASAILAAIPTLLIYMLAGKYFVRGLMAGSVKG